MKLPIRASLAFALALAPPAFATLPAIPAAYDDCDARFVAPLGSDTYQFHPGQPGKLGLVRLFTVLSNQGAAAEKDYGRAFWRLEIRGPVGSIGVGEARVREARGVAAIGFDGVARAEFVWDGRDANGRLVPPGKYLYTFTSRYLPERLDPFHKGVTHYEDLTRQAGVSEAFASTAEVIANYGLDAETAAALRASKALGVCQVQQNAPLEGGFGYNFYYGSTHSHSNASDGGHPTTACNSGNASGSGTWNPAAVYNYARTQAGLDFWLINEHNHLLNDSVATNNAPVTAAKVRQRYADGRAAATAATVNDSFVALYGMEWGVLTNGDQGHVTLIDTPALFGWEPCTTCNGPSAECTPGTSCYFDVFTPKRFGYLTLYRRSVENPSPAGALGILCHPSSGEFDNFAFNADADQALQGIAVRSGLAFNTAADCSQANVASSDYVPQWKNALNRGFHVGPTADHDAHCNNFGAGLPNRTVYLLPNAASPTLTKLALLQAHKARHFFATEDANAQLVFATADGAHIMGDIWSAAGGASLRVAVYDPNGEAMSSIEVWRGQIGGGVPSTAYRTVANQSTLTLTETLTSGTYYYFVRAVQADGNTLWSSPMWITYGPGGGCGTCSTDVSGWRLAQINSTFNYTIPANTRIPDHGYLVIGRNATKAAFEAFWRGGTPLPANVLYLNAADTMPVINGSEQYTLTNPAGTIIDGRTIAMPSAAGSSIQRKDPCLGATLASSWTTTASSTGTPGTGAATGCARGVVINEFSDALGTGNFIYEFIELHNDR